MFGCSLHPLAKCKPLEKRSTLLFNALGMCVSLRDNKCLLLHEIRLRKIASPSLLLYVHNYACLVPVHKNTLTADPCRKNASVVEIQRILQHVDVLLPLLRPGPLHMNIFANASLTPLEHICGDQNAWKGAVQLGVPRSGAQSIYSRGSDL